MIKKFIKWIWLDYITSGINITQEQASQRVDEQYLEIRRVIFINIISLCSAFATFILIINSYLKSNFYQIIFCLIILLVILFAIISLRITKKPNIATITLHFGFSISFFISIHIGVFNLILILSIFLFGIISFYISEKKFALFWNSILYILLILSIYFGPDEKLIEYTNTYILQVSMIFFFSIIINYFHQSIEDQNELQMLQSKKELANSFNQMVEEIENRRILESKLKKSLNESANSNERLEDTQKAMINVMEDLEHEKESILQKQAKDEAILGSIGDGLIVTDTNRVINLINKACTDILGFESKDIIGKKFWSIFNIYTIEGTPIKDENGLISRSISEGVGFNSKIRVYENNEGKRIPLRVTVTPIILDGKVIGSVEAFRDITEELEVDRSKTEFVSLASHQLKTPLSAINWYSELLLSGQSGELTKDQKDFINEISLGSKRMNALVNSLLNVSRIDLGTFAVDPELTDMIELSNSVIHESIPMISEKQQSVVTKYQENLPKLIVDPKLMRIVIQNLITNSVKYTPDKGNITLEISIDDKNMNLKVSDTGYGIPDYQRDRIFQKLFRADNILTKETDGTGLGLYIVKSIIEASSGKIWFESEEHKGTTFYLSIPLTGMLKKEGKKALS